MKLFITLLLSLTPLTASAQSLELPDYEPPQETFVTARVVEIIEDVQDLDPNIPGYEQFRQVVTVELADGAEEGKRMELDFIPGATGDSSNHLEIDDRIVILKSETSTDTQYFIFDHYRFPVLVLAALIFALLIIAVTRFKGVRSLIGLIITIVVLVVYILPSLVEGANPLSIALVSALIIAVLTLYTAHGFKKTTSIALASTALTIILATALAWMAVLSGKLFGLGTESAFYLQLNETAVVNLRGLLLAGIIIGSLGILDDITITQVAFINELKKANQGLSPKELFLRGMSVGREHIASLINTLVLAYAGASLPLLLHFTQLAQPIWVTLNSEIVAEEIVRTLVGSAALILAVPITSLLAAHLLSKQVSNEPQRDER